MLPAAAVPWSGNRDERASPRCSGARCRSPGGACPWRVRAREARPALLTLSSTKLAASQALLSLEQVRPGLCTLRAALPRLLSPRVLASDWPTPVFPCTSSPRPFQGSLTSVKRASRVEMPGCTGKAEVKSLRDKGSRPEEADASGWPARPGEPPRSFRTGAQWSQASRGARGQGGLRKLQKLQLQSRLSMGHSLPNLSAPRSVSGGLGLFFFLPVL